MQPLAACPNEESACASPRRLQHAIRSTVGDALRTVASADAWDQRITVLIAAGIDFRPISWRVDRVTNAIDRSRKPR